MLHSIRNHAAWLLPLLAMLLITPFISTLDLQLSHYFYDPEHSFPPSTFASFMFVYGLLPAQLTFIIAAIMLFLASFFKKWKKWLKPSLVMVLTLAIGSGLIGHVIFKDHWGRPRPRQVIEFGGYQPFRPYYSPNFFDQPEPSKSFPCGHCTMGFYFFALALVAKRTGHRTLFWLSLLLAIGLGLALSYARIIQGGHFLSDTIAAAIIMWLTAYYCDRMIYVKAEKDT